MKEVVTIICEKDIDKDSISKLPFLEGIDIWKNNDNRSGEVITRIKEAAKGNEISCLKLNKKFLMDHKGILFKEENSSSNYYIIPQDINEMIIFRINKIKKLEQWIIKKENELGIELVYVNQDQ